MVLLLAAVLLAGGCTPTTLTSIAVVDSTLAENSTSYWLFADHSNPKTVFTARDEQVTLHARLDRNLVASTQTFRVVWYEPDGRPYVSGGVRTVFGSNQDLIVSLKLAGTSAAGKFGVWRVEVYHGDQRLLERSFEVRPAP